VDTNLLTHQIAKLVQELSVPSLQGEEGFEKIILKLDEALRKVDSNVLTASLSDFRKLYHVAWKGLVESICEDDLQQTLTDRFKKLVF
jgi:hypothetical protein